MKQAPKEYARTLSYPNKENGDRDATTHYGSYGTNLKSRSGCTNSEMVASNGTVVRLSHVTTLDKVFFVFHFTKTSLATTRLLQEIPYMDIDLDNCGVR